MELNEEREFMRLVMGEKAFCRCFTYLMDASGYQEGLRRYLCFLEDENLPQCNSIS